MAKKFPSLKTEYAALIENLEVNPQTGVSLGHNCHKIRISIASKGKGKSGGGRLITQFYIEQNTVYLLTIYDKSDQENISDQDLLTLIQTIK